MVFKDARHWDAFDRFASVDQQAGAALRDSLGKLAARVPVWRWRILSTAARRSGACESAGRQASGGCALPGLGGDEVICRPDLPASGLKSFPLAKGAAPASTVVATAETIETTHYLVRIDTATGALVS